jgi:hypothetical protein
VTSAAYRTFLRDHVGVSPLELRPLRLRLEEQLAAAERAADRRFENAKHAPTATDRLRALERADALDHEATVLRNQLADLTPLAPASCIKCAAPITEAQAYEAGRRCRDCFTPSRTPTRKGAQP